MAGFENGTTVYQMRDFCAFSYVKDGNKVSLV